MQSEQQGRTDAVPAARYALPRAVDLISPRAPAVVLSPPTGRDEAPSRVKNTMRMDFSTLAVFKAVLGTIHHDPNRPARPITTVKLSTGGAFAMARQSGSAVYLRPLR